MTIHETENPHASDLVKALNITPPTASQALKTLVKKGWLIQHPDKHFTLTQNAEAIVQQILKNKALFMDLFVNFLGVDKALADADSCKIEHLISPEVGEALEKYLHEARSKKKSGGLPVLE